MKLLTKEVQEKLPALYSTERVEDPTVVVKFFNPCGAATWWLTEGSPLNSDGEPDVDENGKNKPYDPSVHEDFHFFGLCDLGMGFPELGRVSLRELESVRLPFGLGIERDRHLTPAPLSTFRKETASAY